MPGLGLRIRDISGGKPWVGSADKAAALAIWPWLMSCRLLSAIQVGFRLVLVKIGKLKTKQNGFCSQVFRWRDSFSLFPDFNLVCSSFFL